MLQKETIIDAAAVLFYKEGFGYVSLKDISEEIEVPEEEVTKVFPNEALVCTAWLENVDTKSDQYHQSVLLKDAPAKQKVNDYFADLAEFMKNNLYRGCPFSNVASTLSRTQRDNELQQVIVAHKRNLKKFLTTLATEISPSHASTLGDSLFLLYSGATTESRNLQSLDPIISAQKSAAALCEAFS